MRKRTSTVLGESASLRPSLGRDEARGTPDVAVVGASAGGVDVLKAVVAAPSQDYAGAVFVVLHIPPSVPSLLATVLARVARGRRVTATDGAPVEPGAVDPRQPHRQRGRDVLLTATNRRGRIVQCWGGLTLAPGGAARVASA